MPGGRAGPLQQLRLILAAAWRTGLVQERNIAPRSPQQLEMCDKIFGKKEDNFHFPIRARYAS
jgi:hypothetical protein